MKNCYTTGKRRLGDHPQQVKTDGTYGFNIIFGKERLIAPGGLAIAEQLLKRTDLRRWLNKLGKRDLSRKAHT